jgi:hypothetical protein
MMRESPVSLLALEMHWLGVLQTEILLGFPPNEVSNGG